MTTASRSHRLTFRVQNIEASLPALEKAVLAQTSHIHLAYTAGMVLLGNYLILCVDSLEILIFFQKMLISFLNVISLER